MSSRSTACAAIGRSALIESGGRPDPASDPGGEGIALYLHIPFCLSKCPYCDFNTYEGIETLMGGYIAALAREIELWGALLKRPRVTSIYFGGGTPSYIPPGSIDSTMAAVHEAFNVLSTAEISMEANPGDITSERVESWRSTGINRMSIGVQSFDDGLLVSLGRRHNSDQAAESSARIAKSHGFENFSLDLMFGLPNQIPRPMEAIPSNGAMELEPLGTCPSTAFPWNRALLLRPTSGLDGHRCRILTWGPTCIPSQKIDWRRRGSTTMRFRIGPRPGIRKHTQPGVLEPHALPGTGPRRTFVRPWP